jgi:hypothetical protein
LAGAAALVASSLSSAQDFTAQYEPEDEARIGLRWSVPLTSRQEMAREAKTLSLTVDHRLNGSQAPSLDVFSFSFDGERRTSFGDLETFSAADDGEGGLFSTTRGKVLLGAGVALAIWGIVELTDDDDDDIVCITAPCT